MTTKEKLMTRTTMIAAMAALMLTGCPVSDSSSMGDGDAGVNPTTDGGPVPSSCEEDPARVDVDGDGWCPAGRDLNADGFCCSDGESLPPEEGDCNDNAAAINPGASEVCGNAIDEDCGESPCATPGDCPDPDVLDPQCGGTPDCDDHVACTTDFVGDDGDCEHVTRDDRCAGGQECDAALGCVDLPDCVSDSDCSDGVSCSADFCDSGTCRATARDDRCGSGEVCDLVRGCITTDVCVGRDCSDAVACTVDSCSGGVCRHTPDNGRCAAGQECDAALGCVDLPDCVSDLDCADGILCTHDFCAGGVCGHTERDDRCSAGYECSPASAGAGADGCRASGVCTPGATRSCYGGPAGTSGVGICRSGTETCLLSGGSYVWGSCAGEVRPTSELCATGTDDDCDGTVNEGCLSTTYYRDADGDGYGTSSDTRSSSGSAPDGYIATSGDCNDSNASVHPGRSEICGNGVDEDCSGGDLACTCTNTFYRDNDSDGYGSAASGTASGVGASCSAPSGHVASNTDCNDSNSSVNPGAAERCDNSIDDDCDGLINEGCTCSTYYRDVDGDGYGSASSTTTSCTGTPPGYVATSGDCNDANASVHPGATEVCGDGVDNDCSGGDATCGGTCGGSRTLDVTYSVSTPGTATVSSSSRIRWNFWFECGAATVARETGVSSASFSVSLNAGDIRKFNGEIFSPAPSGTLSTGEPISQWLCQEPRAGEPRAPFGAPSIRDGGRTYVYDGVQSPGGVLLAGHMVIAHDGSIPGGWGCNFFLCPFDGGSCRIP